MKMNLRTGLGLMALLMAVGFAVGCEDLMATPTAIRFSNSGSDDMELVIDGVSSGFVAPGNSKTVNVASGRHAIELKWSNGRYACTPSAPVVEDGSTYGISCSARR